jgi:ATP phosphoribosyltransferase regulatory subunit HisZ
MNSDSAEKEQALQELQTLLEELGYAQVNPSLLASANPFQFGVNSLSTRLRSFVLWLKPMAF